MKLNQKDARQTEDKESIRQCKIKFQTKTNEFFFICSRPSSSDFLDMTSSIIQNSACHFGRHNKPTFLYFLAVGSL